MEKCKIVNMEDVLSIPNKLQEGKICIGTASINGVEKKVYFNEDKYYDRGLIVSGRMGSGKGEYLKNYIYNCLVNDKPVVIIDYVDNIDLGDLQKKLVDEGKMIVIDLNDPDCTQSLSYNELNFDDKEPSIEKMYSVQYKSHSILKILEGICNNELTNSMKKYFVTASNIVYSVDNNASVQNIIDFLESESVRDDYLNKIPDDLKEYLEHEINVSKKLNNPSGAQLSLEKLLDIAYMLKQDMTTRLMMKKTSENNIDFTKCLEEGKSILIKTNVRLCNKEITDILNVFFIEKVDIASRMRKLQSSEKTELIHFVINDEIHSDKVIKRLREMIPNTRVQNLKLVVAVQSLDRIEKLARDLESIGFNYMFLSGLDKSESRAIRNVVGIKVDDIYDIPKYHSVNLIMNEYYKHDLFITKLPPVL